MKIFITGAAGFIGYHVTLALLSKGYQVVGLDNINDYYDVRLKHARLEQCGIENDNIELGVLYSSTKYDNYRFVKKDIEDSEYLQSLFKNESFDYVIHLAAQAGVRYSLESPMNYICSNVVGFLNILEACRSNPVKHLVYASSSSVYGTNTNMPFNVDDSVDHPISLYAATKKSNELMAHTYSHLFKIPTTGVRFFTVYGPWGRPDMSPILFANAINSGDKIRVFNNGEMARDFTYIDDIVNGLEKIVFSPARPDLNWDSASPKASTSNSPYRLYNIGNSSPTKLMDFIREIEFHFGIVANKEFLPIQPGDVVATWADVNNLKTDFGYSPSTELSDGVKSFVEWYKNYYS